MGEEGAGERVGVRGAADVDVMGLEVEGIVGGTATRGSLGGVGFAGTGGRD